jgi:hypothetical protein
MDDFVDKNIENFVHPVALSSGNHETEIDFEETVNGGGDRKDTMRLHDRFLVVDLKLSVVVDPEGEKK